MSSKHWSVRRSRRCSGHVSAARPPWHAKSEVRTRISLISNGRRIDSRWWPLRNVRCRRSGGWSCSTKCRCCRSCFRCCACWPTGRPAPAQFLILGSASPDLIRGASETLAGRVAFVYLSGFDVAETGAEHADRLWERGGFPRSFLALDDAASYAWRQDFIETFLSRDAARFGITLPPEQLRRFWTMLAHLHGGVLHTAELARAVSVDQKTASRYVDIPGRRVLLRRLPPWFENTGKRVVKAPKCTCETRACCTRCWGCGPGGGTFASAVRCFVGRVRPGARRRPAAGGT